ncbi:MAG: hypothetical protein KDA85_09315, partial [Planctomycetaceae bacterium]|nr:hypothetical protein [Planctomycetaceae bacterium]
MRIPTSLLLLVTALLLPPVSMAQTRTLPLTRLRILPRPATNDDGSVTIQVEPASEVTPGAVTGATGADTTSATAAETTNEPPEFVQKKQQILKTLAFDRRPSAILNAWATPLPPAPEAAPAETNTATTPATAAETSSVPGADSAAESLTEEEQKAKAAAAAEQAAAAAAQKAAVLAALVSQFEYRITKLRRSVTLGQWDESATLLRECTQTDREAIYTTLLQSLVVGPPDAVRNRSGEIIGEKNVIRVGDIIAIAEFCPKASLQDQDVALLAQLINACGNEGQAYLAVKDGIRSHVEAEPPPAEQKLTRRIAARLLFASGHADDTLEFLPELEQAITADDFEALDLLADASIRLFDRETDLQLLEQAWSAVQAILAHAPTSSDADATAAAATAPGQPNSVDATNAPATTADATAASEKAGNAATNEQRVQKALRTAVSLVPRIREELGRKWLADSFTAEPVRGKRILNGIGGAAARGMVESMMDADQRVRMLQLQQTAIESLLAEAPQQADEWKSVLHLMAVNWLREAVYSSQFDTTSQRGPVMQRDEFGNLFWSSESVSSMAGRNGNPSAIPGGALLDVRPSDAWLAALDESYRPTLDITTARLHLKVKEEEKAFPYIESLAQSHPLEARELVEEFLRIWADNHDPNANTRRTSIYMYSFGYSTRAAGIPLTRSHQQRNLKELASWVARIRSLPITDIQEDWITAAFMRVHSAAEVYSQEDIEHVFGDIEALKPETLASLLSTMRSNLNSVWRAPQIQQDNKTNRRKQDIEAEVKAGYRSAIQLCEKGLRDAPDHWRLLLTKGALLHDENNYLSDLQPTSDFTENRRAALTMLQQAAQQYASLTAELKEEEYSVEVFNTWFYASLGDCSLGNLSQQRRPATEQLTVIQTTMQELPPHCREKHLDMFANDLFTRMSSVNPAVKFEYVREGLKISGDRKQGAEAAKVLDYYSDLVTEIRLSAQIDGPPQVGHETPFGVFIAIEHTKAIERESGGFGRYLQNQNSGGGYYYNNGRPTEDYRDKFEQAARDTLNEHFEVLSVTFEPENINSRAADEPGWRETPYAYVLLKAR